MVEDATNKLAPPTFVIVFARPINCRSRRHFFPSRVKRLFEFLRIQFQTNLMTDQSVMVAYGLREKKKRPGSVEKDRFDHSEFQGVRYLARTISHKAASITSGSGSQARIEGIHQSPNNARSADRADLTGTHRPSSSRSIPTVI